MKDGVISIASNVLHACVRSPALYLTYQFISLNRRTGWTPHHNINITMCMRNSSANRRNALLRGRLLHGDDIRKVFREFSHKKSALVKMAWNACKGSWML